MPRRPGPPNPFNRKYRIGHVQDNHREVIRLCSTPLNNQEIAERVGLTPQQVSNIRNSPLARTEIDRLQEKKDEEAVLVSKRIQELAYDAIGIYEDVVRTGQVDGLDVSPGLRLRVSKDVLEKAGNVAPTKLEQRQLVEGVFRTEHIVDLVNRVEKAGVLASSNGNGEKEEAEYKEVVEDGKDAEGI